MHNACVGGVSWEETGFSFVIIGKRYYDWRRRDFQTILPSSQVSQDGAYRTVI